MEKLTNVVIEKQDALIIAAMVFSGANLLFFVGMGIHYFISTGAFTLPGILS
ncbi:hypothetical protein KKH23_04235 [Patescibacteria group bacterium]|nr:hypothetical protein [Patescibacteria group bacterium]